MSNITSFTSQPITIGTSQINVPTPKELNVSINLSDFKNKEELISSSNKNDIDLLQRANLLDSLNITQKVSSNQYLNNSIGAMKSVQPNFNFDLSAQRDVISKASIDTYTPTQKTQLINNLNQTESEIQNVIDKLSTQNNSLVNSIKKNTEDSLFIGRLQTQGFGAEIDISSRNLSNVADSQKIGEQQLIETQQKFNQGIKDVYTAGLQAVSQITSQATQLESSNRAFATQEKQIRQQEATMQDQRMENAFGKFYLTEVSNKKDANGNFITTQKPGLDGTQTSLQGASNLLKFKEQKFKFDEYVDPTNVAYRDSINKLNIKKGVLDLDVANSNLMSNAIKLQADQFNLEKSKAEVLGKNTQSTATLSQGRMSINLFKENQNKIQAYQNNKDPNQKKELEAGYLQAIKDNQSQLASTGALAYMVDFTSQLNEKTKQIEIKELMTDSKMLNLFGIGAGQLTNYLSKEGEAITKKYFTDQNFKIEDEVITKYYDKIRENIQDAIYNGKEAQSPISKFVIDSKDGNKVLLLGRNLSNNKTGSQMSFVGKIYDFTKYTGNKEELMNKIAKIEDNGSNLEQVYKELEAEKGKGLGITSNTNLSSLLSESQGQGFNVNSKGFMTDKEDSYSLKDVIMRANLTTGAGDEFRRTISTVFGLSETDRGDIKKSLSKQIPNLINNIPSSINDFWKTISPELKGNYATKDFNNYLSNKVGRTGDLMFLEEGIKDSGGEPTYSALDWYIQNSLLGKEIPVTKLSSLEIGLLTKTGVLNDKKELIKNEIITNYTSGIDKPETLSSILSKYKQLKKSASNNANGFSEYVKSLSIPSQSNIYDLLVSNNI